jgi:hypothetical protein
LELLGLFFRANGALSHAQQISRRNCSSCFRELLLHGESFLGIILALQEGAGGGVGVVCAPSLLW